VAIHVLRNRATPEQIEGMLGQLGSYIKVAVDVRRGILAGGGEYHADCEALLLEDGSRQEDIWGADWYPESRQVRPSALINIRPGQGNRSMEIQDPALARRVQAVVRGLLEEER
jgi:hypothetical protein